MRTRILPGTVRDLAPDSVLSPYALLRRILGSASLRRERKRLAQLDTHLLRDIGVSRDEAIRESNRKGWDAPDRWKR